MSAAVSGGPDAHWRMRSRFAMHRSVTVGIDIGTYQVKVVVAESGRGKDRRFPTITGTGIAESRGLRHGYIVNVGDVSRSVSTAVAAARQSAGVSIKRAYLSIGGESLEEHHASGEVVISRADAEVGHIDLEKVIEQARRNIGQNQLLNRKILHTIPLTYYIDGEPVMGRAEGMKGAKLSASVLFITCLEQHYDDLVAAVEDAGVEVEDTMASPLAGALVTTSREQKMAGCLVANIGAETTSILVFENGIPTSLRMFTYGSTHITNDIAIGLQVPLNEAEQIKRGAITGANYSREQLEQIVQKNLSNIFTLINKHLRKLGKSGLLPAGVILTGGGSALATIEDLARSSLRLPATTGRFTKANKPQKMRDASWAVAYGLCIWGFTGEDASIGGAITRRGRSVLQRVVGWCKQFLP